MLLATDHHLGCGLSDDEGRTRAGEAYFMHDGPGVHRSFLIPALSVDHGLNEISRHTKTPSEKAMGNCLGRGGGVRNPGRVTHW
jgi:hypothetical protein